MSEQVGKCAVIRQQQQAFAVFIQTADGIHPAIHAGEQIHNGLAAAFVRCGGNIAAGLVKHQIGILALAHNAHAFAVNADFIKVGVHLIPQRDRVAVDLDAAFINQFFCSAAGAHALVREYFLNPLFCHGVPFQYQGNIRRVDLLT